MRARWPLRPPSNKWRPFCSERCRLLDLGKWASGDYRISSPILDPDLIEVIESGRVRGGNSE